MKKIVLDTNAYSNFLRGDNKVLAALTEAEIVYMSIFVIAELLTGFKGGQKEIRNKNLLKEFLEKPTVQILDGTTETSEFFAEVKNTLKQAGNPIPINDVWIAAHTLETGSTLITYDKHFHYIPGLRVWDFT
jgi:tRNA(fMet)-specific endonuclease VapC